MALAYSPYSFQPENTQAELLQQAWEHCAADRSNSTSENLEPQAGHHLARNVGFCAVGNFGVANRV
jgi:hypothetical protein